MFNTNFERAYAELAKIWNKYPDIKPDLSKQTVRKKKTSICSFRTIIAIVFIMKWKRSLNGITAKTMMYPAMKTENSTITISAYTGTMTYMSKMSQKQTHNKNKPSPNKRRGHLCYNSTFSNTSTATTCCFCIR